MIRIHLPKAMESKACSAFSSDGRQPLCAFESLKQQFNFFYNLNWNRCPSAHTNNFILFSMWRRILTMASKKKHVQRWQITIQIVNGVLTWLPYQLLFLHIFEASLSTYFRRVPYLLLPVHGQSPRKQKPFWVTFHLFILVPAVTSRHCILNYPKFLLQLFGLLQSCF